MAYQNPKDEFYLHQKNISNNLQQSYNKHLITPEDSHHTS